MLRLRVASTSCHHSSSFAVFPLHSRYWASNRLHKRADSHALQPQPPSRSARSLSQQPDLSTPPRIRMSPSSALTQATLPPQRTFLVYGEHFLFG